MPTMLSNNSTDQQVMVKLPRYAIVYATAKGKDCKMLNINLNITAFKILREYTSVYFFLIME